MTGRLQRGFTLIELLVTIAIIGVLVALLMPAVQSAREAARRSSCRNHLKQLALALHNYHDAHRTVPPGCIIMGDSPEALSGWGWGAMVLPFTEQSALYNTINFELGTTVGSNRAVVAQPIPFWWCPSDIGPSVCTINVGGAGAVAVATGNYCGSQGMLSPLVCVRFGDVTDGLSQTLMLGERVHQPPVPGFDNEFTS